MGKVQTILYPLRLVTFKILTREIRTKKKKEKKNSNSICYKWIIIISSNYICQYLMIYLSQNECIWVIKKNTPWVYSLNDQYKTTVKIKFKKMDSEKNKYNIQH
jgi:hypothetical protein